MLKIEDYKQKPLEPFWHSNAPKDDALLKKNAVLRDRHMNERCFILANGPSIKRQDIKLLRDETCIVVSDFDRHPDYRVLKPRYHCVSPFHPPDTEERWFSRMDRIDKNGEDTEMFFGLSDRERNSRNGLFANKHVYHLKFTGEWRDVAVNGIDLTKPVPKGSSVPVFALFAAIYLGFKRIYLMGCDHDWILNLQGYSYFYNENNEGPKSTGYNPMFESDFEAVCRWNILLWQQYKTIRRIAYKASAKIYNATDGGFLDVFPRINYMSVLDEFNKTYKNDINNDLKLSMAQLNGLRNSGKTSEAYSFAQKLLGEFPDSDDVINAYGELSFENGRWFNAMQLLEDLARRSPGYFQAYANLGVIYWQIGDGRNSMKSFLKAIKINPYHRDTILNFAGALKTIDEPETAKKVFAIYLQKHPDDAEIAKALAEL